MARTGLGNIDYHGVGSRDSVTCYLDNFGGDWPYTADIDPLSVEPIEEANPEAPDSGSSTTQFVFRVRYRNADGTSVLPPRPWLHDDDDPWSSGGPSGVVLYLDLNGTGDYRPHFMHLEKPDAAPGDDIYDVYIYRIIPGHVRGISGSPGGYPMQRGRSDDLGYYFDNYSYQSLAFGTYHYYFACSDDSLTFDDGSLVFDNQGDPLEWGQSSYWSSRNSTGLDPSLARSVAGYEEVARTPKRKYSSDGGTTRFDYTIYVDRPVRVPGLFETQYGVPYEYQWKAEYHPEITCELRMPVHDDKFIRYDDQIYGSGRFFGTIANFRRASNPAHRGSHTMFESAAWAETCGHESSEENVFRILYKSKYNEAPIRIKVHINNASEKNNPQTGDTPDHAYTAFTMQPRSDQTPPYDYTQGIWYEYKTTELSRGPHTYYFEADDGRHVARFPVRPDHFDYSAHNPVTREITGTGTIRDWWVPTYSKAEERGTAGYYDNDYFPGPYINHPCVLSEATVIPGTGKEGDHFRYRVKYSDLDGQRVYAAHIIIEVNDVGDTRTFAMVPETPIVPPLGDAPEGEWLAYRQMWIDGVYYVLDTASLNDFALDSGVRRYRFQFMDDWGRLYDINDTLQGEWTFYPEGAGNWISGPVISGNIAPTLYDGSVESEDGTANAATLWTYRVTYRDVNNDEPELIKMYIGLLQPDQRTIIWNAGHTMEKSDPGDMVYSDGVDYHFKTRLTAADTVAEGAEQESKQYYYAFEAYDGVKWAQYRSSSDDELRSDAAGCYVHQGLEWLGSHSFGSETHTSFKVTPLIVQQGLVSGNEVTPDEWDDILVTEDGLMVEGVYATEDLTGTNYLAGVDLVNEKLQISGDFPAGVDRAWIQYEAQSPIIGPVPVELPAPAGVIPDALIFEDRDQHPVPVLIDDQKDGWIRQTDDPEIDRGILVMRAVATYQGQPSVRYVIPEMPSVIASVEGVYVDREDALDPSTIETNYYDIGLLDPPSLQVWEVNPGSATISPLTNPGPDEWSDRLRIDKVMGVYDPNDLGADPKQALTENINYTNYYQGEPWVWGEPVWQEALVVGSSTIWPKNPNQIASVESVQLAMDQSLQDYYNPNDDGLSLQGGTPSFAVEPSDALIIDEVLGIYLAADLSGDNYYDPGQANPPFVPGDTVIIPTTPLPQGVTTVYISYLDELSVEQSQEGTVVINGVWLNDPLPVWDVRGVYQDDTLAGTNYYDPDLADPPFVAGDAWIYLTEPMPVGPIVIAYISRGFRFGPENEYLALGEELPQDEFGQLPTEVFIAYHMPGDAGSTMGLREPVPVGVDRVYVHVRPHTYKCGRLNIPLTSDLDEGDRTVYVRYSHIQFTHRLRGEATQQALWSWWDPGTTHYTPDGWMAGNVHINGNKPRDEDDVDAITSGIVGVWLNSQRVGVNYLDPRKTARLDDDSLHARLTTPAPDGTNYLWARYYQNGVYHIDRWNREVVFLTSKGPDANIEASYFFGAKMPWTLGSNTPPTLEKVDPDGEAVVEIEGGSTDKFEYSIKYSDPDGPNGQAPAYVRVYIDGVPYDMGPDIPGGTPAYNVGAVYKFTASAAILASGSHKYHFETSDGAAIAWFDANGGHQSYVGSIVDPVKDMDGPWINDAPVLSDGMCNPSGTIGINDSVDYTVVYKDVDNDAPYVHDPVADLDLTGTPVGADLSGSPRVWIDIGRPSAAEETDPPLYEGTVAALQADPLDPGKTRQIVVSDPAGWTTAEAFSGKLMQFTSGAAENRVYLIQSGSGTTLTVATLDLAADGVQAGDTFRINGLLMRKADPTQEDFTQGITYKVTIPRLPASDDLHTYYFTARSREYPPQWLKAMEIAAGGAEKEPMPYSDTAWFPRSDDTLKGPKVVATIPEGNLKPELSNSQETSLYSGPKVMLGAVVSPSIVYPASAGRIRSVLGVYVNADQAYDGSGASYYDPDSAPIPFQPGDTQINLAPALPGIADTDTLVQLGVPGLLPDGVNKDLWTVVPQDAGAIGSVEGVYLLEDATTNYYDPGSANPPFSPGDGSVALTSQLPSSTELVYVFYKPITTVQAGTSDDVTKAVPTDADAISYVVGVYLASDPDMTGQNYYDPATASPAFAPGDADITLTTDLPGGTTDVLIDYVLWPPVYVRHFAQPSMTGIYLAGEPLTFRVDYRDPDNDPPTYHDGVQGSISVALKNILGTERIAQMLPLKPPVEEYTVDVPFTVTLTDVPEGVNLYRFEASDGYYNVRYPPLGYSGYPTNDYTVQVNYKPVIRSGGVDHTSGATTFAFTVVYEDKDGVPPPAGYGVVLRLIPDVPNPDLEKVEEMTMDPADPGNFTTGVVYEVEMGGVEPDEKLVAGQYTAVFEAHDGIQPADPLMGPTIIVRETNIAPVIKDFSVTPAAGKTGVSFTYSGFYHDYDNDAPVTIYQGETVNGLTLVIDQGSTTEKRLLMLRAPAPPPLPDYTTLEGVEYRASVSGRQLGAGHHTYVVVANDGTDDSTYVQTGTYVDAGPAVMPENASIIESVVGVYDDAVLTSPDYYGDGTFVGGTIGLSDAMPPGTMQAYVRYDRVPKEGPILMVPYFDLDVVTRDGVVVTERAVVGEEVLIEGQMFFPYNTETDTPAPIGNLTIHVTKPDGTAVALNASVRDIAVDDPASPQNWVGEISVRYDGYVDPALATGSSLTLTASGQWTIGAVWPGDFEWDRAETDITVDGHNDSVSLTVSGPNRTIATTDPYDPATSAPVVDMITVPMVMGSTDPGEVFRHHAALEMRIVRWSPSSRTYFRYGVSGLFPALASGDAMWIKPRTTYPAAEPLGLGAVQRGGVVNVNMVMLTAPATTAYVSGVYLNQNLTGANYFDPNTANPQFRKGDLAVALTNSLPWETAEVWVSYVVWPLTGVDEGWIALDNPVVARSDDGGEPLYYHTKYRLVKALTRAYPVLTDTSGNTVLDPVTKLALLKPCFISVKTGWNQFGNIFFNWRKSWQQGAPVAGEGDPALLRVVPSQPGTIGKVLGVYVTESLSGTNYYVPGTASQPYRRGDALINLTAALPAGTSVAYIRHELYPREDVGIPISEVRVSYLGESKSLSEAAALGWIHNYAWRYDATGREYVQVQATGTNAERILKAWSGYWIRAFVDCQLEINPNTTFNGTVGGLSAGLARERAVRQSYEMPPPAPD